MVGKWFNLGLLSSEHKNLYDMCLSETVQVRFSCGIGLNVLKEELGLFIYVKFSENFIRVYMQFEKGRLD